MKLVNPREDCNVKILNDLGYKRGFTKPTMLPLGFRALHGFDRLIKCGNFRLPWISGGLFTPLLGYDNLCLMWKMGIKYLNLKA